MKKEKKEKERERESEADKGNKHTQETEQQLVREAWWQTEEKKSKNKFSILESIFPLQAEKHFPTEFRR